MSLQCLNFIVTNLNNTIKFFEIKEKAKAKKHLNKRQRTEQGVKRELHQKQLCSLKHFGRLTLIKFNVFI